MADRGPDPDRGKLLSGPQAEPVNPPTPAYVGGKNHTKK